MKDVDKKNQGVNALVFKNKKSFWKRAVMQKTLILMTLPFIIHFFIFNYLPMYGIVMAFQDFKPYNVKNFLDIIFSQKWVGFDHFIKLFKGRDIYRVLLNTLAMSLIGLVFGSFFPVFLSILLNETRNQFFKRGVQTISYLPHFISWVVVANIIITSLSSDGGIINKILLSLGILEEPILFMGDPKLSWWIISWAGVWKGVGWGAVIYLAAMTGIDTQLYDAAEVDGAGRLQKIFYITLPGIQPTFMILFILAIGGLLSGSFEVQYLFRNSLNYSTMDNLAFYVFQKGIRESQYSFGTAASLFNSLVNFALLFSANTIAKKLNQTTLF